MDLSSCLDVSPHTDLSIHRLMADTIWLSANHSWTRHVFMKGTSPVICRQRLSGTELLYSAPHCCNVCQLPFTIIVNFVNLMLFIKLLHSLCYFMYCYLKVVYLCTSICKKKKFLFWWYAYAPLSFNSDRFYVFFLIYWFYFILSYFFALLCV